MSLPRPLVTTKAFPEDEGVTFAADGTAATNKFVFEQRIGQLDGRRGRSGNAVATTASGAAGGQEGFGLTPVRNTRVAFFVKSGPNTGKNTGLFSATAI